MRREMIAACSVSNLTTPATRPAARRSEMAAMLTAATGLPSASNTGTATALVPRTTPASV
jgi:hypothetical protein